MTDRGALPSTVKLAKSSESMQSRARPLTRSVFPRPGMRNKSATRGSRFVLPTQAWRRSAADAADQGWFLDPRPGAFLRELLDVAFGDRFSEAPFVVFSLARFCI